MTTPQQPDDGGAAKKPSRTKRVCTELSVVIDIDPDIKYLWEPTDRIARLRQSAQEIRDKVWSLLRASDIDNVNGLNVRSVVKTACDHCNSIIEDDITQDPCCCDKAVSEWEAEQAARTTPAAKKEENQ